MFLLKTQVVDTLVQRVTISKARKINVEIWLDLLKILDQDAGLENLSRAAYSSRAKLIAVYLIYAALGNYVFTFEIKKYAIY